MFMNILIVESQADLGNVWKKHFERQGMSATLACGYDAALEYLHDAEVDLVVLDLVLEDESAMAIADYVNYRYPKAPVVFVSSSSFFSDGSIFQHVANARAIVDRDVRPDDLMAMVEHYTSTA
jgi:DNA-binding response OmpR family regulator